MSSDQLIQMRHFIETVGEYTLSTVSENVLTESIADQIIKESDQLLIINELHDLSFRLRAFMESQEGDFGLGVETGMQRAADMIDNLIRRHEGL